MIAESIYAVPLEIMCYPFIEAGITKFSVETIELKIKGIGSTPDPVCKRTKFIVSDEKEG